VRRSRPFGEQDRQRLAFDKRHGEIGPAVGKRSGLEDRNDPRMMELGNDASLLGEPAAGFGVRGDLGRQELDRQLAVERRVVSANDDAHAAAGDFAKDAEPAEEVRNGRGRARRASG
jgi:hypothetical protein